ncbi:MAG: hypothetical protein ACI37S_01805 [Candidatus Gastranaerophilaceae bacterium]
MNKVYDYLKSNWLEVVMVCIITLFAVIVRTVVIQNYGELWLDELYSLYFSYFDNVFQTVSELVKQDLHMPLYFVILHFWIKIFGVSDISFHSCSLMLSIPLIPIAFYSMKSLFNRFSGYLAAILFSINTFCAYYSVELRFYCLVLPLTLLSAVYFVKMLENLKFKNCLLFVIFQTLLIYTFSIAPLLSLFYLIVGFIYLLKTDKICLKPFFTAFFALLILSLPAILISVYNFAAIKSSLVSFQGGIYLFDWKIIFDILENFFSTENFQILTLQLNNYENLVNNLGNVKYVFFVLIPIVFSLIGFVRALLSKNNKLYLLIVPSILFLVSIYLFAAMGFISFLTKYAIIVYPMIICAACYGLSLLNKKYVGVILGILIVVLNYFYILVSPHSVLALYRVDIGNLPATLEKMNESVNDLFLIPYSGSRMKCYINSENIIPFDADDMLLLKNKKAKIIYFGDNANKINRKNLKDILYDDIAKNQVSAYYEKYLLNYYLANMQSGQKLFIVFYRDLATLQLIQYWDSLKNKDIYNQIDTFSLAMAKVSYDSVKIAEKYLKPINSFRDEVRGYSIFVYQKQ